MKKSARLISIVAAAALTPLLLAGCVQANPNAIGSLSGKNGTNATAAPAVNANTPSPSPTISKGTKLSGDDLSKAAANESKGYAATDKHSVQEVQNAIYSAKLIIGAMQNDNTFLNGNWAKNSYAQDDMDRYTTFFTDATFKGLMKDVTEKDSSAKSRTNLLLLTNYFPESDGHYVLCPDGEEASCNVSSYPKYANLRYSDDKAGGIDVYFDIENRYVATLDGARGYLPVKSTIILNMVADPAYTKDSGSLPFIIDGWSGTYERGSFAK